MKRYIELKGFRLIEAEMMTVKEKHGFRFLWDDDWIWLSESDFFKRFREATLTETLIDDKLSSKKPFYHLSDSYKNLSFFEVKERIDNFLGPLMSQIANFSFQERIK